MRRGPQLGHHLARPDALWTRFDRRLLDLEVGVEVWVGDSVLCSTASGTFFVFWHGVLCSIAADATNGALFVIWHGVLCSTVADRAARPRHVRSQFLAEAKSSPRREPA